MPADAIQTSESAVGDRVWPDGAGVRSRAIFCF